MADDLITMTIDSKSLEEKLKGLDADLQTRILNAALRKGAQVYQAAVEENAPMAAVAPSEGSDALPVGALKSDVIISKAKNTSAYEVKFGKYTRHVARWMDRGFQLVRGGRYNKGRGTGKVVKTVEPKSIGFFRKSFEQASSTAETVIETSIREDVEKAWNK